MIEFSGFILSCWSDCCDSTIGDGNSSGSGDSGTADSGTSNGSESSDAGRDGVLPADSEDLIGADGQS